MSKRCSVCGKKSQASVSRSHSNVATKRRLYPNLQTKTIDNKKKKVCAQCIKTINKESK